jgi:hypothetical protein
MKYKLIKDTIIENIDKKNTSELIGGNFNDIKSIENPKWPPLVGKTVIIKNPNYKETFIGKIFQNIWNNTSSVILLMNHQDYIDDTLKTQNIIPGKHSGRGLFLLLPGYAWRYLSDDSLNNIVKMYGSLDNITNIHQTVADKYNNIKDKNIDIITDDVDKYKDTSLLQKGINFNNLFKENEINILISARDTDFYTIDEDRKKHFQTLLRQFATINPDEIKFVVNKNITYNFLMKDKSDESNEATKIINWVRKNFVYASGPKSIFTDLKALIANGYVYFFRTGISVTNTITKELIPNLKYFIWQYNIPIDYDTLKYVLFQNKFQKTIKQNTDQQEEAESILSQEYLVALQPEPKYQLWCLKRLLTCWYSDSELEGHIRKIKVLINHYRTRSDKDYNKTNGILPSIVIYPKYGSESARIVVSKLSYYFSLYKTIGCVNSDPDYFVRINPLLYYTNGAIDLKMYFKRVHVNFNRTVGNDTFNKQYTKIMGSKSLMDPSE